MDRNTRKKRFRGNTENSAATVTAKTGGKKSSTAKTGGKKTEPKKPPLPPNPTPPEGLTDEELEQWRAENEHQRDPQSQVD